MRRVLHGDISAVACVLYPLPKSDRSGMLARLFAQADAAEIYRKYHRSLHPVWGDGSLMSAALTYPHGCEPFLDDPDYAACMAMIFTALSAQKPATC